MSILKQFAEQDFCTTYTDDGEMEVVSKKIHESLNEEHEYIAIRRDFLENIDKQFDAIIEKLDRAIVSLEEKDQKIHILNECCMKLENELGKMTEVLKPLKNTRN